MQIPSSSQLRLEKLINSLHEREAVLDVLDQIDRAQREHPDGFAKSHHRAYGVLMEEIREWEAEIFKRPAQRDRQMMRREAAQIAATMILFMEEMT